MSNADTNIPLEAAPGESGYSHAELSSVDAYADAAATPGDYADGFLEASGVDPATGALIGDAISGGDAGGDLGDLHAALASLSGDAFAYLDIALDHLTSTTDLFDVPAMDFGDFSGDASGS